MTTAPTAPLDPIALQAGEGESLWVFGSLATIKASSETTAGRVAVIDVTAPQGSGSPLHVHHREDEWFFVIEGALTFLVDGERIEAPAGSFVYGPRDVQHTFVVSSPEARFLLVTEPAGFERFMRAMGRPAPSLTIPPPADPPSDLGPFIAAAAEYGIEILGPSSLSA